MHAYIQIYIGPLLHSCIRPSIHPYIYISYLSMNTIQLTVEVALLERIREREAKREEEEGRLGSKEERRKRSLLQQLPELGDVLISYFKAERRSACLWKKLLAHLVRVDR